MSTSQWIPATGLVATVVAAGFGVVHLDGQTEARDFSQATMVQVRGAQGEVLLQGTFGTPVTEDDGLERRAMLTPAGSDPDASGSAEIEIPRRGRSMQEVEFTVRNLDANRPLTFVIDGMDVTSATTDRRGRAHVELKVRVPAPAAPASR